MPNTRRRKFSVKQNIKPNEVTQSQNAVQVNMLLHDSYNTSLVTTGDQTVQNTSNSEENQIESNVVSLVNKSAVLLVDKDVLVSLSKEEINNDSHNKNSRCDKSISICITDTTKVPESSKQRNITRRERYARQHKIKIRNPRRRIATHDKISLSHSEGTNTDISRSTFDKPNEETVSDGFTNIERGSDNSIEDMCRICHGGDTFCQELGDLISACSCRGTVGRVHVRCLERWLTESGKSRCELCGIRYVTRRVHRYGIPRSLVMWILSQNAKQLMVDTLGIVLMSPLAVLAAWLSGKTFAALISQENHTSPAPWPLASTFVLACMTLVCYYCWIVSATTRHTLSWWIWYRAQYEVRLQLHGDSED
ncbi:PREDICTED: E3 ubiquitin-protein ligase MARCH8-like [Papilio polytes]|uniref:E3 ubiquitin-protein ligase MARCH8-like n=1 Tax=Papilio polytes TaxID=76194 RepID=UPI0006764FA4|nr:PREDICTED: E3 ubiquitin-protein ligase MARCH8-like [Papilio polytes]